MKDLLLFRNFSGVDVFRCRADELDMALSSYFHQLYRLMDGGGRTDARFTMYGLILVRPELRYHARLAYARAALRGWRRMVPSVKRPPLPVQVLYVMARFIKVELNLSYLALLFLLAFDGYLRIGEVCSLKVKDVRLVPTGAVLRLVSTKTGPNQTVKVRSLTMVRLLRRLVSGRKPEESLFGYSKESVGSYFRMVVAVHGWGACLFTFHSIRHGAATEDLIQGVELQEVLRRGRWAAAKSARHYIQEGEALIFNTKISQPLLDFGKFVQARVWEIFSSA